MNASTGRSTLARVAIERLRVFRFLDVVEHVAELNRPESVKVRAVRIALHLGERVVLSMDGHPLLGGEPRGQPETHAEHERNGGMQLERLVSGASMEKNRGAEYGDLGYQRGRQQTPEQ